MKEIVLPSRRFCTMRPITWFDWVATDTATNMDMRILLTACASFSRSLHESPSTEERHAAPNVQPEARAWRALVQFGRDAAQPTLQAIRAFHAPMPSRLLRLIDCLDPELLSPQAFRELVESMPGVRT